MTAAKKTGQLAAEDEVPGREAAELELARQLAERAQQDVQPRRDLVERPVECRAFEDLQGADHLQPGRAALRRGADHDVAGTEHEPIPAGRVRKGGLVANAFPQAHAGRMAATRSGRQPCRE